MTTDTHSVVRPEQPSEPALTVADAIEDFIEAAEEGRAVNRSGRSYRPSALRDLTGILRLHVAPLLGDRPLAEVRRDDIQLLVDRLGAEGLSESRIRSVISALRGLYGYATEQGQVEYNPADSLTMPSVPAPAAPSPTPTAPMPAPTAPMPAPPMPAPPVPAPEMPRPSIGAIPQPPAAEPTREDERDGERERYGVFGRRRGPDRDRDGDQDPDRRPDGDDYEPIALLPERLLAFALRAAIVIFAIVVIISLLQPA